MSRKITCTFKDSSWLDWLLELNKRQKLDRIPKEINIDTWDIKYARLPKKAPLWVDMPEYRPRIRVAFVTDADDYYDFECMFKQEITRSICYPEANRLERVVGGKNPKYPVYVESNTIHCSTVRLLNKMNVPHYLIADTSQCNTNYRFTTPLVVKGDAAKFCKEHDGSHYWLLSDDIQEIYYESVPMRTGACFSIAEEFFTRFANLRIGSLTCKDRKEPYTLGKHTESCMFINNNKGTDCTINAFRLKVYSVIFTQDNVSDLIYRDGFRPQTFACNNYGLRFVEKELTGRDERFYIENNII